MSSYLIGIDIGGTFTDCIVMGGDGEVRLFKAPSTPDDFSRGFFDALELAASGHGIDLEELLHQTERLVHGTTVATNAVVEHRGARTGLITTRGHADMMRIMRAFGRVAGLPVDEMLHIQVTRKPRPLVPPALIHEVSERTDCLGQIVVELNEDELRASVEQLVAVEEVEALAVCFLWSFRNPQNEQRAAEIIRELAPDTFLTISSNLLPVIGEYERATGTVINAMIGPVVERYLAGISSRLRELGYDRELLVMSCNGGMLAASEVARTPILSLGSGPVAGVAAAAYLGQQLGARGVLATDVGGTTFDAGLVINNSPVRGKIATVDQYEFFLPHVSVKSIGAGGGSIVWVDEASGALRVGPQSAGADPGPACYGRGSTQATLTDADVVLGYLGGTIAEGRVQLDLDAATRAVRAVGAKVGLGLYETAAGIARVAELQMANVLHQITISRGHDPRHMILLAYGGAGPLHAAVFAPRVGVPQLVVPMGNIASGWSAQGCVASDLVHVVESTLILGEPFDTQQLEETFRELEHKAREALRSNEIDTLGVTMERFLDMRYVAQINEVEVATSGRGELNADELIERFERRYEDIYGKGSGFRGAGIQIVTIRVRAIGRTATPSVREIHFQGNSIDAKAAASRLVYWFDLKERVQTPVFDASALKSGVRIVGPAIVDLPHTTLVIHPAQAATVDSRANIVMEFTVADTSSEQKLVGIAHD